MQVFQSDYAASEMFVRCRPPSFEVALLLAAHFEANLPRGYVWRKLQVVRKQIGQGRRVSFTVVIGCLDLRFQLSTREAHRIFSILEEDFHKELDSEVVQA